MALDKATLITDLETAFGKDQVSDATAKANITVMATAVADAVDVFVKSGTVNTTVTTPDTINGTGVGVVT